MSKIIKTLKNIYHDEKGLTTVEYAIAGGLVGATVVAAFTGIGTTVLSKINAIITSLGGTPAS